MPGYIGLTSDSEHVAGCRYDAPGRLTAVVAQSDPDFVKALDTGKRELRLLELHIGLRGQGLSETTSVGPGTRTGTPGGNATIDVVQSEKRLSSYVRTMADLVALRRICLSPSLGRHRRHGTCALHRSKYSGPPR